MSFIQTRWTKLLRFELVLRSRRDAVAAVRRDRLSAPRSRVGENVAAGEQMLARTPAQRRGPTIEQRTIRRADHVDLLDAIRGQSGIDKRTIEHAAVDAANAQRRRRCRSRKRRIADVLDTRIDDLHARLVETERVYVVARQRHLVGELRFEAERKLLHVRLGCIRIVDASESADGEIRDRKTWR